MKLRNALLLVFIPAWLTIASAPVTVTGKVNDAAGKVIRLVTFTDHVSYLNQTLALDTVSPDGTFSLRAEINSTRYSWLDIDFQPAELTLKPGGSYEVELHYDSRTINASYYDRPGMGLDLIRDDDDHTNHYIRDFNRLYNDFLLGYASGSASRNPSGAYETFRKAIELRFRNAGSPYVNDYIRYKTAAMQLFLKTKSRENIGMEYLASQPVLYDHIEYMDFFQLFFEKYFIAGNRYFTYNTTNELINGTAPLAVILDSLAADPVLGSRELRELLLLQGLKDLYGMSGFKKNRITGLIHALETGSDFAKIREVASGLLVRLNRLQPGTPAPALHAFALESGEKITLEDFAGRKIYLVFFSAQNAASLAELALARDLIATYGEQVSFLAVSVDRDPELVRNMPGREDILWEMVMFDGTPDMLEDFDATTLPHFLLIGPDGKIVRCPAPSPSENVAQLLQGD